MHDTLKCPECHKVIDSVDTSQKFIHCPFCQIRILIPEVEPGHHLSFHQRDLNEVIEERHAEIPHEKHSKLKLHKDRGAITEE